MGIFENNIYNKYLEQEWSKKFQCAGIYLISVNGIIVYIGKSKNILYRMAEHWVATSKPKNNKYKVLAEARKRNMKVRFDVLYRAKSQTKEEIENEIGEKEGYYIRKYMPPLNNQIPQEDDWRRFSTNKDALSVTLDEIIKERGGFYFG